MVLTADHKPQLEQQQGAARLAAQPLFWDEGVGYLSKEEEDGSVQRLAVSRALGDFDLSGDSQRDSHSLTYRYYRAALPSLDSASLSSPCCV